MIRFEPICRLFSSLGCLVFLFFTLVFALNVSAQTPSDDADLLEEAALWALDGDKEALQRLFMPSIQMGLFHHNRPGIADGLIIQTSIEYRTKKNWLIRANYDDFSATVDMNFPNVARYKSKLPMYELLAGIGYRQTLGKHNVFLLAQTGLRFYEMPVFTPQNGILDIDITDQQIQPIRYTLGYEYEIEERVFINIEGFLGHFATTKDYWNNDKPFWGVTLGLSTNLF